MRILAVALCLVAGCDYAFGLTGQGERCSASAFTAKPTTITAADTFSVSSDESVIVFESNGFAYQITAGGTPVQIDLGIYPGIALALSPEGDELFRTAAIEPPLLQTETRTGAQTWQLATHVPAGVYAGTPTAKAFGPRHVMVRLRADESAVQEYEEADTGEWVAVGSPQDLGGALAPNLHPNGLTMVFAGSADDGSPAVLIAARDSVSESFGKPTVLLAGDHRSPQLGYQCDELFVIEAGSGNDDVLARYGR